MNKNLFNSKSQEQPQIPTTPKKKSQYVQKQFNTPPKIKYRYTIVQKPVSSWMGRIFLLIWLSVIFGSLLVSYQSKLSHLQNLINDQIDKCKKDYELNKCDTPLKGIKQFCEQKHKCMQNNPQQQMKIRAQGTLFLGSIIRQFFEGLGLPMVLIGLVYLMWGNRKSSQVKKEFVEYYP